MPAILCEEVAPGMRESERCVSVRDIHGHREWLLVEHSFLAERRKPVLQDCELVAITDPAEQAALDRRCRVAEKFFASGRSRGQKQKPGRGK